MKTIKNLQEGIIEKIIRKSEFFQYELELHYEDFMVTIYFDADIESKTHSTYHSDVYSTEYHWDLEVEDVNVSEWVMVSNEDGNHFETLTFITMSQAKKLAIEELESQEYDFFNN